MATLNAAGLYVQNEFLAKGNVAFYAGAYSEQSVVQNVVVNQYVISPILKSGTMTIRDGTIKNATIKTETEKLVNIPDSVVDSETPVILDIDANTIEVTGQVDNLSIVDIASPVVELSANFSGSSTLFIEGAPSVVDGTGSVSNSYALLVSNGAIGTNAGIESNSTSTGSIVTQGGILIKENIYFEPGGIHLGGNTNTLFVGIIDNTLDRNEKTNRNNLRSVTNNTVPKIKAFQNLSFEGNTVIEGTTNINMVSSSQEPIVVNNLSKSTSGADTSFVQLDSLRAKGNNIWIPITFPYGNWQDIIFTGDLYCAIGYSCCATSSDGENWTVRNIPQGKWKSIAWSGSEFCVVGETTSVAVSNDGISWTTYSSSHSSNWNHIIYNGTLFCAISSSGGNAIKTMTSTNGTVWEPGNTSMNFALYSVAYGSGVFVANGNSYFARSINGKDWTNISDANFVEGGRVVYGDSYFLYVVSSSSINYSNAKSTNGQSWTFYSSNIGLNESLTCLKYENSVFIGCSKNNGVCYSLNGETVDYQCVRGTITNLAYGDSFAIGVSTTGDAYKSKYMYQQATVVYGTGISFPDIVIRGDVKIKGDFNGGATQVPFRQVYNGDHTFSDIAWNTDLNIFCTITYTAPYSAYTSKDGTIWLRSINYNGTGPGVCMTYGGGKFVVFTTNECLYSTDGLTWNVAATVPTMDVVGVTYGNSTFVAVTGSGAQRSMTSSDGNTWTLTNLTNAYNWNGVNLCRSYFIAYGNGAVARSSDGINWINYTGGNFNNNWRSASSMRWTQYMIVGDYGKILYTENFSSWNVNTVMGEATLSSVVDVMYSWYVISSVDNQQLYISWLADNYVTPRYMALSDIPISTHSKLCFSEVLQMVVLVGEKCIYRSNNIDLGSSNVMIGNSYGRGNVNFKGKELLLEGFPLESKAINPSFTSTTPLTMAKFTYTTIYAIFQLDFIIQYTGTGTVLVLTSPVKVCGLSIGDYTPCIGSADDQTTACVLAQYTATNQFTITISNTSGATKFYGNLYFERD